MINNKQIKTKNMQNLLNEVNQISSTILKNIKLNNRNVKMQLVKTGQNDIYIGVNNYKLYIVANQLCYVCT